MEDSKQFEICQEDILTDLTVSEAALIAVLIEVEHQHKGTLAFLVRILALVCDDWRSRVNSSNPERSLQVQKELVRILANIDQSINSKEGSLE